MPSEAQARITINKMLEEAGWRFLPDAQGRRENIVCEHRITRRAFSPSQDLGKDFEHAPQGFVDYVLLNTDQRPVAVTEAKREGIDPLTGKEQARSYAESLGVSHIFLSNGLVHYYWNLRQGNPVKVSRFLPLEQLGKAAEWRPDPTRLAAVTVDENYIAVSQDAAWLSYSPADRAVVMVNKKIRLLREYQVGANFTLFSGPNAGPVNIIGQNHQFFGANKAIRFKLAGKDVCVRRGQLQLAQGELDGDFPPAGSAAVRHARSVLAWRLSLLTSAPTGADEFLTTR